MSNNPTYSSYIPDTINNIPRIESEDIGDDPLRPQTNDLRTIGSSAFLPNSSSRRICAAPNTDFVGGTDLRSSEFASTYNSTMFYRGNSHPRLFSIPDKMKQYDFHPVPRISEDPNPIAPGLPLFDYIPQEQAPPAIPREQRPLVRYVQNDTQPENGPIVQYVCNRGAPGSEPAAPPAPAAPEPIYTSPPTECPCAKCSAKRCRPRHHRRHRTNKSEKQDVDQEEDIDQEIDQPTRLAPSQSKYDAGIMAMSPFNAVLGFTTPTSMASQPQSVPSVPVNYPTFSTNFKPVNTEPTNASIGGSNMNNSTSSSGFQGVDNAYSSLITNKFGGPTGGPMNGLGSAAGSQYMQAQKPNQVQAPGQAQSPAQVSAQTQAQAPVRAQAPMDSAMALQQQMMMQQYQMQMGNVQQQLRQPNVQSQPQLQHLLEKQIQQLEDNIQNLLNTTQKPNPNPIVNDTTYAPVTTSTPRIITGLPECKYEKIPGECHNGMMINHRQLLPDQIIGVNCEISNAQFYNPAWIPCNDNSTPTPIIAETTPGSTYFSAGTTPGSTYSSAGTTPGSTYSSTGTTPGSTYSATGTTPGSTYSSGTTPGSTTRVSR